MFAGRDDVEELAIGRNGEIARSQPDCGQLIASGRADWEEWPLPKNSLTSDISFGTLLVGQKCGFLPVSAACLPPFLFSRSPAGNANLLIGVGFSGHVRGCGLPATVDSLGLRRCGRGSRFLWRPFARRTRPLQTSMCIQAN